MGFGYLSGHWKGVSGNSGKDMGLMGQVRDRPARKGLVHPSTRPANPRERKGGRASPSFLPLLKGERKGGRHLPLPSPGAYTRKGGEPWQDPKRDSASLGAPLGLSPLPPTYIYEEGGA